MIGTLVSPDAALRVESEFSPESLKRLCSGDLDVIWHPTFHPPELAAAAVPRIEAACDAARYTLTRDLQSVGTSIGEAADSQESFARYHATARATTALIRDELFAGQPSPLDRLRLLLDEYWPAGAAVARSPAPSRWPMLAGIVRRWPQGGYARPHIDQRENGVLDHLDLELRIGANVYLEVPTADAGGELQFWERINERAYAAMRRADYGLDPNLLGPPAQSLRPRQGDLVMFDTSIIHGVVRVLSGSRVTAGMFVGYAGEERPLTVFA